MTNPSMASLCPSSYFSSSNCILSFSESAHFSPVVSRLSSLSLSLSMATVNLLALDNGMPDAFASLATLLSSYTSSSPSSPLAHSSLRSSLASSQSSQAPSPSSPIRSCTTSSSTSATSTMFYIYLSTNIYLWQAIGFVGFSAFLLGWCLYGYGGTRR